MSIIGKIWFSCLMLLFFASVASEVTLSVRDDRGGLLSEVGVKDPFYVYLTMHDIDVQGAHIDIPRLRHGSLQRISVQMRNINGVSTTTYIYQGIITSPGKYEIGPISVGVAGKTYESNISNLLVHTNKSRKDSHKNQTAFVKFIPSKTTFYVGESVPAVLRFYFSNRSIHPEHIIQPPEIAELSVASLQGPYVGTETIDGQEYEYLEWRSVLKAEHSGIYEYPAYSVEYSDFSDNPRHRRSVSLLFRDMHARKRAHGNSVSLKVIDIPFNPHASGAIGSFDSFTASCDTHEVACGEGCNVSFTLCGKGVCNELKHPLLSDIPHAFKYYTSNVTSHYDGDAVSINFEYVVHCMESGLWEIPSQTYVFFDPEQKQYRTLITEPLTIMVKKKEQNLAPLSSTHPTHHDTMSSDEDNLAPLREYGPWTHSEEFHLNPQIFLGLLFAPLLGLLFIATWRGYLWYYKKTDRKRRFKNAYKEACKSLEHAFNKKEYAVVRSIFISFFSKKLQVDAKEITEFFMQKKLSEKGVSSHMLEAWQLFWCDVCAYAFAENYVERERDFEKRSSEWLLWLHQVL